MPPRLRTVALTVHVTSSIGWLGAVIAFLALDITAQASDDVQTVRAAYLAMETIIWYVLIPLALAALLTGIIQSLGTTWGLLRHYWVLFKLVLTIVAVILLVQYTPTVVHRAGVAASVADPRGLPSFLLHSVGGLVVLLVVTILAVFKPRGTTRYGWRKRREQQRKQNEQRNVPVP
ncbi:DUF2269 domain-containing protein [Nonomuraea basaltis]|nr:DUF2269 domain-containing protein [Nonomuraea basaltis]